MTNLPLESISFNKKDAKIEEILFSDVKDFFRVTTTVDMSKPKNDKNIKSLFLIVENILMRFCKNIVPSRRCM